MRAVDLQLRTDVLAVGLHGQFAQEKLGGDLFGGFVGSNPAQNFAFHPGEVIQPRRGSP
jgi:hypothetical protein